MTPFIELNDDAFAALFKPLANPIDDNAAFDFGNGNGTMFETHGNELALVQTAYAREPRSVWTLTTGDDGDIIQSGFHFVNRLGYFITEIPAPRDVDIQVVLFNDSAHEIPELADDLLKRVEVVLADNNFCASHAQNDIEYTLHRIRGEVSMAGRIYRDGGDIAESGAVLDQLNEIVDELAEYETQRGADQSSAAAN